MGDKHSSIWSETFTVRSFEVDATGRLTPPALLHEMQEAAGGSADSLGFSIDRLFESGVTWVLARLRVALDEWPRWRDTMTIETWPAGNDGMRAYRDFRFLDGAGRQVGSASSLWMVLDLAKRRPARVPGYMSGVEFPDRPRELPGTLDALARPVTTVASASFRVRWRDLDMNRHANNACFVEWAREGMPEELREHAAPSFLAVDFRAEARLGDEIVVESAAPAPCDGGRELVQRIATAGGRDLATVRTVWPIG